MPPFLLVTVSIAVGYLDSSDNYFIPEDDEIILSKFLSIRGVIDLTKDGYNKFGAIIKSNNLFFKVMNLYNQKINDLVFSLGLDVESYTLTISVSPINKYVSYTFRFTDPITNRNYYEIQIKIELNHSNILSFCYATQEVLVEALNKAVEFDQKYGKDINIFITAMILAIIILTVLILAIGPIIAGAGVMAAPVVVVINEIRQLVQTLNFEFPINLVSWLGH